MATFSGQTACRQKGQTKCIHHQGKQLEIYCERCDVPVCVKCLLTTHKAHDACELSKVTSKKKQDIRNFIDKIEQDDLVHIGERIASTESLLEDNTSNFEKFSQQLKMQTDKIKEDLDMLAAQTLSLYQKMEEDNTKLIEKYKQDLEIYEKQLKQQIQECKTILQRDSHIEIYDTDCEIDSQINLPIKPVLGTASFTPNKTPQHHLEPALGRIETTDQGQAPTDKNGSVGTESSEGMSSTPRRSEDNRNTAVTRYKLLPKTDLLEEWTSVYIIGSVCPTTDGRMWTSCSTDALTLVDRRNNVIQEVNAKATIKDISQSPVTNTIWVCDNENNILELVSGQLTHRFRTKEEPISLCVTASNHVIVGMVKLISKFTTTGHLLQSTLAAGTGKPLVCTPYRIAECPVTNNVAMVDWNRRNHGGDGKTQVVVMDANFNERFVYRGEIPSTYQQTSSRAAFDSWGVVYDSTGNLVIGDYKNCRVLLLSGSGEFLRILHTDKDRTVAVGMDREDVLWSVFGYVSVKRLQYNE
ncbi:uncharacterized protein LOC117318003 [Pecten maximus]|uniref:uncharacterized protein LOC117318003 n=1 Tax=Pecten maximus TaxID=6579 RepID=UPI0014588D1C|nr:uncharacterized protein LOC117318003 [Pecten maximus]